MKHWAVLNQVPTITAAGVQVVVTTNAPCHLWMRWTYVKPQVHLASELTRGTTWKLKPYFCLVAYHDNEQEEAGDTLTHTFTKEPWAVCETRFYYFWGTIAGLDSPSETPFFEFHRTQPPITTIFYSSPAGPPGTCDGYTQKVYTYPNYFTWPELRDGPGTHAGTGGTFVDNFLQAGPTANKYTWLIRTIHLFDTSSIPPGATITAASFTLTKNSATNFWTRKPSLGVYTSNPASNTALIPADYNTYGSVLLSSTIDYDTFAASTLPLTMDFNAAGLAAINKGGITKLAIRDATRDGPNLDIWERFFRHAMVFWTAEVGIAWKRPFLSVTYTP